MEDHAVDAGERRVTRVPGGGLVGEGGPDLPSDRGQFGQPGRGDGEPEGGCRDGGVAGARVRQVDRDGPARGGDLDPSGGDPGGYVAEGHAGGAARPAVDEGGDPAGGHVDPHPRHAVRRRRDQPRVHRPGAERHGAVAARGGVAVLVPEQHAQVRALVVRRDDEAAVHPAVAARLVREQPADVVQRAGARGGGAAAGAERDGAALGDGAARDGRQAGGDDPERLARRVVVDGLDHGLYRSVGHGLRAAHPAAPAGSRVTVRSAVKKSSAARPCSRAP